MTMRAPLSAASRYDPQKYYPQSLFGRLFKNKTKTSTTTKVDPRSTTIAIAVCYGFSRDQNTLKRNGGYGRGDALVWGSLVRFIPGRRATLRWRGLITIGAGYTAVSCIYTIHVCEERGRGLERFAQKKYGVRKLGRVQADVSTEQRGEGGGGEEGVSFSSELTNSMQEISALENPL